MSRDADRIMQNMLKKQEQSAKSENLIARDIAKIQKDMKALDNKLDLILDILNNFTLMILEENEEEGYLTEDDVIDEYDSGWTPEQGEEWNDYEDES